MTDAKRIDEPVERYPAPRLDRVEQIAHRGFAETFLLEQVASVLLLQCKDVARFFDPFFLEEQFDLFLAQTFDIEGTARHEQRQMLNLLIRAGEFAGAAGAGTFLAGRGFLAHHLRFKRARAPGWKLVLLFSARLVGDDIDNLRNNVPCPLHHDRVADAKIAAVAQLLAPTADALDVILVVQCDVLHDHAADADRLQLAHRRERAGAANLYLNSFENGDRALGRKLVRDAPARHARHESEPFLPVDAVDLVDDAIDVIVEFGPTLLDLVMEGHQLLCGAAEPGERIGLEAAGLEPLDHAGLRVGRHFAHFAPGVGKKSERPR